MRNDVAKEKTKHMIKILAQGYFKSLWTLFKYHSKKNQQAKKNKKNG